MCARGIEPTVATYGACAAPASPSRTRLGSLRDLAAEPHDLLPVSSRHALQAPCHTKARAPRGTLREARSTRSIIISAASGSAPCAPLRARAAGTLVCIAADAQATQHVKSAWQWLCASGLEVHVTCANAYLQALLREVRASAGVSAQSVTFLPS